jgi:putative ABC transport system substrate-binding protein
MLRRNFLAILAAVAATRPFSAAAQQGKRLPVVALVYGATPTADMAGADPISPLARSFVHGMRDLGWVDGRNCIIERYSAENKPERARTIFADLVAREVKVIALGTGRWLQDAALAATRTIPLLAIFDEDPVAVGLISSLARPGGNLTGVSRTSSPEYFLRQLQLLLQIVPNMKRVALIATPDVVRKYVNLADIPRVALVSTPVEFVEDFEQAFTTIRSKGVDGIVVSGNAVNYVNARRIAEFAIENRLPTMFGFREGADSGGLISFGTDPQATYRQIARQAAKFLEGAKIGDIPTEQPTTFELVINLKTAKALGLTVPQSLLLQADAVIR